MAEIEAQIESHRERYERHLRWKSRNEKYQRLRNEYCSGIEEQISELRHDGSSYRKILGVFRTRRLTAEAVDRLKELQAALARAEVRARTKIPELGFPFERFPNNRAMVSDWSAVLTELQKELELARKAEAKAQAKKELRARVAKADGRSRRRAMVVKGELNRDYDCPYCGGGLGPEPHADHIYPIGRGGLSVKSNMVYVCAECNQRKGDKTLRMYIAEFGLDRRRIEGRLDRLGKEY